MSMANPYPVPLNPGFFAARFARQKKIKRLMRTKAEYDSLSVGDHAASQISALRAKYDD